LTPPPASASSFALHGQGGLAKDCSHTLEGKAMRKENSTRAPDATLRCAALRFASILSRNLVSLKE
ncbi:hypothetical protein LY76DRAFT_514087, partial [Colletotrichum caudatum]